jgi:hypothetical protein
MTVKAYKLSLLGTLILAASMLTTCVVAAPAFAASSWWHLTSGSRPTNLQAGLGKSEVQQITVKATEGEFVLSEPVATAREEFFNANGEPEFAILPFNATARQVEEGLEGFYGAGNVQVAGGPGDASGSKPYVVSFTGALADRRLEPIATRLSTITNFPGEISVSEVAKGQPDGQVVVTASNLGDANANGASTPVRIVDKLPPGLKAVSVAGIAGGGGNRFDGPVECTLASLECKFASVLPPYDQIEVVIGVVVEDASSGEFNEASVSGGGTPDVSTKRAITVSGAPTPFGVEGYEMSPEEESGAVDTQAGSHPFQLTTTLALNEILKWKATAVCSRFPRR